MVVFCIILSHWWITTEAADAKHREASRHAPTSKGGAIPVLGHVKRLFDVFFSGTLLVITSPVWLVVSVIILVTMGRPIFFRQVRAGQHGRTFTMWKFRTMLDLRDADGNPLPDEVRLTRLGVFLRRTSIDELPELINVLVGDMSLVGPRPLLVEYLRLYTPEQMRRHEVPPGITGWAQINGRNSVEWEERFALDVWYVDNWSLKLDCLILLRTAVTVLTQRGINAEGHSTMPNFTGSPVGQSDDGVR